MKFVISNILIGLLAFAITQIQITGKSVSSKRVDNQAEDIFDSTLGDSLLVRDCGTVTVYHDPEDGVSPTKKTVTYGSVAFAKKCWTDRNLGASKVAKYYYDSSEETSGWYWQFNRKQGHKYHNYNLHPGFTTKNIGENTDWQENRDPCSLLLNEGWRLPTIEELWNLNENLGGSRRLIYQSPLKLHAAGQIRTSGTFEHPFWGGLWSQSQLTDTLSYEYPYYSAHLLDINNNGTTPSIGAKAAGLTIRCVKDRDDVNVQLPEVSTVKLIGVSSFEAHATGFIHADGGTEIEQRGLCLSKSTEPDIAGNCTKNGLGSGIFRSYFSELEPETNYYIRAYATNSKGTAYGKTLSFKTPPEDQPPKNSDCGSITVFHKNSDEDEISAKQVKITYGTVKYKDTCWIDRNLGAQTTAAYLSDTTETSRGWYWQFNKKQGYQFKESGSIPSWPEEKIYDDTDWKKNNDPCHILLGKGWRIPTFDDWKSFVSKSQIDLFNSPLGLHLNGEVLSASGSTDLYGLGFHGLYWSRDQASDLQNIYYSRALSIFTGKGSESISNKLNGGAIRCLNKDLETSTNDLNYSDLPAKITLSQNFPNPFNPVTRIRFAIPEKSHVTLAVYNSLGQLVTTLVDEVKFEGWHHVTFDAANFSSGVYIYILKTERYEVARKMIFLK